jgi:hypothetical protein
MLRPFLPEKPLPLRGIDWLGGLLWSLTLLLVVFVCEYGEHYDWLHSPHIRRALVAALLCVLVNLYRMRHIKSPYIEPPIFRYPHVLTMLFLFMALCLLASTSTVLENAYTDGILHYFMISPDTNIELLYFPLIVKNAGTVMLYAILTIYAAQIIPFQHLFQVLCLMGFIREGIGSPIATAYIGRLLKTTHQANYLSLSSELDAQNPVVSQLPFEAIYGELQRQSLLVSIKEIFGYAIFFGMLLLLAAMCTKYPTINKYIRMPVFYFPRRLAEIKLFHRPRYTVEELLKQDIKQ